jgi:hypothetical protein
VKKLPVWLRFVISAAFDTADFFIGRIPVFGTVFDIAGAALGLWLWGPVGLAQGWEILDVTDQIDGFVPTLTISGILAVILKLNGGK